MRIDVLTLFPGMFRGPLDESIPRIAQEKGALEVVLHDLRVWSNDKHHKVDDRPYGGGPGMVLRPQPIVEAVEAIEEVGPPARRILLSPQGHPLDQALLEELSQLRRLVLICGRYEGFDERVRSLLQPQEISLGDYVLSGGELPALVLIDGVARLLEGVLGHDNSNELESFAEGLLEYPQYTRPRSYRGLDVPEVLLSGHHGEIAAWRRKQAVQRTAARRADLLCRDVRETDTSGPGALRREGAGSVQDTEASDAPSD